MDYPTLASLSAFLLSLVGEWAAMRRGTHPNVVKKALRHLVMRPDAHGVGVTGISVSFPGSGSAIDTVGSIPFQRWAVGDDDGLHQDATATQVRWGAETSPMQCSFFLRMRSKALVVHTRSP